MYDLDTVEPQLYSYGKIIKLLQILTEQWQFQTLRGKKWKADKMDVKVLYHYFKTSTLLMYNVKC